MKANETIQAHDNTITGLEQAIKTTLTNRTTQQEFNKVISQLRQFDISGITTDYLYSIVGFDTALKVKICNKLRLSGFKLITSKNYKVWLI